MKTNPLMQGSIAVKHSGIGIVNLEMVKKRANEIAIINGRPDGRMQGSDWVEAKRELTGETDFDPVARHELLSSAYASWPTVATESPSEDTDSDGRSNSARLVELGIEEAEHDTMLWAAKDRRLRERP